MAKKKDRFVKKYSQGAISPFQVWVDTETGVNYLYHSDGYSGGMTVLVDKDGKPVVSSQSEIEELK